jgi:hypothetical protein
MTGRVLGHEPDGPPPYSPVDDLAELCAVAVHRLTASAGDALRMRAVLLRLRDGLDIGMDDSRHALAWREAIERWLGGGMPGTPTGKALAERTEMIATAQRQVLDLNELLETSERTNVAFQEQRRINGEVIAELRAENERLRAELDARAAAGEVRIVPGDRAMLDRVLAQPSPWHPEEGEVVRAAADGYQVTWRGGVWVPE